MIIPILNGNEKMIESFQSHDFFSNYTCNIISWHFVKRCPRNALLKILKTLIHLDGKL